MNRFGATVCISVWFLLILTGAYGTGLSTPFADVRVVDVPLGTPRLVEDSSGKSLVLTNTGDTPLMIHVQAVKPEAQELRPPAEPIEDPNWIIVRPSSLKVGPHETGRFEVILLLPDDPRLRHRMFQAMIWSHSEPLQGQGISLSAGLKSRLRFKTVKE